MARYRLRAGSHIDKNGTYKQGDVFDSDEDLVKRFGHQKFERVYSEVTHKPVEKSDKASDKSDDGLESMTLEELRKFAEGEEIDLGKATRKDEIIKAIRAAEIAA